MKKTNQIARLMSTEMDRKDFLKYAGGILLAVVGVTGLIGALFGASTPQRGSKNGYGDNPYGQ